MADRLARSGSKRQTGQVVAKGHSDTFQNRDHMDLIQQVCSVIIRAGLCQLRGIWAIVAGTIPRGRRGIEPQIFPDNITHYFKI